MSVMRNCKPSVFLARFSPRAFCTLTLICVAPVCAQDFDPEQSYEIPGVDQEHLELPEVLTTTRLRQSKLRVPGTTTIITGDMIRKLGILNLVEVFRLVPGMVVSEVGSNNPVTTYHGTVHYEQRRLQVQIDGRTAYRAGLSDMDWIAMPVALENIERIEVSRGPNSAADGINAFLGSINIITRSPQDTAGVEAYASAGSRGYLRSFTSAGDASADASWRLSYEKRKSSGADRQTVEDQNPPSHDGYDINNINYDSTLRVGDRHSMTIRAGVVDGVDEEDHLTSGLAGSSTNPDITIRDYYLQARFEGTTSASHFYHIQASYQQQRRTQEWTISIPASEVSDLLPPGLPPFPTDLGPLVADINANSREVRQEFEFQDTLLFSPDLKLVSGLAYRRDSFESETYFNGREGNYQSRVFGNLEYSPSHWVTLNAGANWETTTTTRSGHFSPRVASNFIINDNHALRLVFSRAVRTPSVFEQSPDWSYRPENIPAPFTILQGQRVLVADMAADSRRPTTYGQNLDEERITSREISYFGQYHLNQALLKMEVRYFHDDLRDMISGILSEDEWTIDNNVALDQQGVELEGSLEFSGTTLRATYAYLDQDGRYTGDPDRLELRDQKYFVELLSRLSVQHSGSFSWIQELPRGFTSATSFYWDDEFAKSSFKRADLRIARRVDMSSYSYEIAFTLQHYLSLEPWTSNDNIIEDKNQFFIEAGIRF